MTVTGGNQYLDIWGQGSAGYVWEVVFVNSTYFQFTADNVGGANYVQGSLYCTNGIVQVVATQTTLTFVGTSSYQINMDFQSLQQFKTLNGDGNFNSGHLVISVPS